MKIGIISDTHDNVYLIERAVDLFNKEGVSLVLHAGDFISPFVPRWFSKLKCKLIGVYGNNENERTLLAKRFSELGHEIRGYFALMNVEGLKIALLHGHDADLLNWLVDEANVDVVVYGHTHRPEVKYRGDKLIVNPGEACGYLTGRATVAVLDTEEKKATLLELK